MNELPQSDTTLPIEAGEPVLLDRLIVIVRHKRIITKITFAAALLAAVISLLLPRAYTASTRILPPQQNQPGLSTLLGQAGAPSALAALAQGVKNPNDLYIAMLGSRAVLDALIQRFNLLEVYDTDSMANARDALAGDSRFTSGRNGLITVSVDNHDPQGAADIANAYVDELQKLTQTFAVTEAARRRLFFEKQIATAKADLARAESDLKDIQEKTGLIELTEQGRTIISTVAALRAQIVAREVQLGAMQTFATDHNPDVIRVRQELDELHAQLDKMESSGVEGNGDVLVPTGKVPEAGLEYVKRLREVKYHENLVTLLAGQYEAARIDEARDYPLIQVLEAAIPPESRSRPQRRLIVFWAALLAATSSIVWVLARAALEQARQDPRQAERLEVLRRQLWG